MTDKRYTFNEFYEKIKNSGDPVKIISEHPIFRKLGVLKTIYYLEKHLEDLN